jgi:hypothetical protein
MKRTTRTIRSERGELIRSAVTADRSMSAVLSTGLVARDNHKVDPKGWVHGASVPLVDSHRDGDGIRSVLGRVTQIRLGSAALGSGDRVPALLGMLNFADPAVNPDAEVAYQLCRSGFIDSVSVSFVPLEYSTAYDRDGKGMDISSAELLEVSLVAIPADTSAKILARAVRAQLRGQCTATDRAALARAINSRIALDDSNARGETAADRARAVRARVIRAQSMRDETP